MTRPPFARAGSRRAAACVLAAIALLTAPAGAQVREVRLTLDNDAFNFWRPFTARPDRDYTNGIHASVQVAGVPRWAGRLAGAARPCNGAESADSACVSTGYTFGQKIFTPGRDGAQPAPGERPYAGFLYLSASGEVTSAVGRRALGVEVGVTGGPSLGEAVHETWHRIGGFRTPLGWDHQLAFEPGVTVRYHEARLLGELRAGGARVLAVAPEWGASLGNVRTAAHAGARAWAGVNVPHPWSRAADRGSPPFSLYVLAGARQEAVARDLFLDGNTFADGPRVERRPLVFHRELGGGVRYGRLKLEYRGTTRGREYRTQPEGHSYATFELSYRPR